MKKIRKSWNCNFWAKVVKTPSCWLWIGSVESPKYHSHSYGRTWFKNKIQNSHRVAWIMLNGPIQKGFFVCHKCDVPTCVNPKHLYLGSPSDNQKDRWDKKRWKGIKAKKVEVSL